MVRPVRIRHRRNVDALQQLTGAADAAGEPLPHDAGESDEPLAAEEIRVRRGRVRARRADRRTRVTRCAAPAWMRAGSSCRTKRRSSSRCSPAIAAGADGCSIRARRLAEDDRDCRRDGGRGPARRLRRAAETHGTAAPNHRRHRRGERARRAGGPAAAAAFFAAVRSVSSSTRRAPGSARFAAIPTSAGAGARTIWPALAAAELTMLSTPPRRSRRRSAVYATCSSEPEENEGVVDAFLRSTPAVLAAPRAHDAAVPRLPEAVVDARGHLRTDPHRHGLEAFFGAVFERELSPSNRTYRLVRLFMAFGTRVWSAGKLRGARRRAGRDVRGLRGGVDAHRHQGP